jgi:CSLREA domain-containing protein
MLRVSDTGIPEGMCSTREKYPGNQPAQRDRRPFRKGEKTLKTPIQRLTVLFLAAALLAALSACAGGGTLVVNSNNDVDDGACDATHCSLREAINKANTLAGVTTINFDIGGGGVQTIQPKTALPIISKPVVLDGTSQPGYVSDPLIVLDGSLATSGYADGLVLNGGNSTVRRLVINNFNGRGIRLNEPGENRILGCYIGTDAHGMSAEPNMGGGVRVHSGIKNVIGGTAADERNIISGNHGDGIQIQDFKTSVIGNYIGLDVTGSAALPNIGAGVMVEAGLAIIGGDTLGMGNVISGNASVGISFQTGGTDGFVQGNLIGTDATGKQPLGNDQWGVVLHDDHNTIGGDTAAKRNVISANGEDGVFINVPSEKNFIQRNLIGTDISGTAPLPNQQNGIRVAGNENAIGGEMGVTGNVISANLGDGVYINGLYNDVQGNFIGVDVMGYAPLGNHGNGVSVDGNLNMIGGFNEGEGNVISANEGDGVHITSESIEVKGNFIGTDRDGTAALGNLRNGIFTFGMGGILIGGSDPASRNLISANQLAGIYMDENSNAVDVYGNLIGTDVTGTAALGNVKTGIRAGGTNHRIGLAIEGGRNLVSGNLGPGIAVLSTATGITIRNNYIGTDVTGTAALGNSNGIEVGLGAGPTDVTIGGSPYGEGNLISGNDEAGILLYHGAKVRGNIIGADNTGLAALGNGADGIRVKGPGNDIGGTGFFNIIAFNGGHGVAVISESGGATDNPILSNSIHDNGGLGIAIGEASVIPNDNQDPDAGDNNRQNFPVLTSAVTDPVAVETDFTGILNSMPGTVFVVEFFTNASCDPSGYGEGHRLVKQITVTTDMNGNASLLVHFTSTVFDTANFITATATDPAGNTSGFSNCIQVTETAAATEPPAFKEMTFTPFVEPSEIFYGPRCSPDKVRISVEIVDPPEPISYVLLFVRLMNPETGETTVWDGGWTMLASGKDWFYYDLLAYDVPGYDSFETAWLQYQFVVYNKAQEKIGMSPVYGDISFLRCGAERPKGAE